MCGIIGCIYKDGHSEVEAWNPNESAELMFPAVEHRGRDAFGFMWWDGGDSIKTRKAVGRATKHLSLLDIPYDARWWIGHVRLATHGSERYPGNNHPLVHGEWIGVHNGIVCNYRSILKETGREDPQADVDSEAILAAVDAYGLKAGLKKVVGDMAAALVDRKNPATVYLVRGETSPLWLGKSVTGAWYFASEAAVLRELGIAWDEDAIPSPLSEYHLATIDGTGLLQCQKYQDRPQTDRWSRYRCGYPLHYESLWPAMECLDCGWADWTGEWPASLVTVCPACGEPNIYVHDRPIADIAAGATV